VVEGSPQGPDTRDPRVSVSAGLQDWQEAPEYQELKSKRFEAGQNKSSNYFGLYRATMTGPSAACSKFFKSQGLQERQQVVFLSHGGEDVSNLQFYLNPQAEHLLDWLHVTMRLTVLTQTAKGLQETGRTRGRPSGAAL
jgi:hypothetical protein